MKPDLQTYLKFWDGNGITSFYFYYPDVPNHIPRLGDCARPIGTSDEVFIPPTDEVVFEKAKTWAREKWGCEIVSTADGWGFCKIPNVEGEFNESLRKLKEETQWKV